MKLSRHRMLISVLALTCWNYTWAATPVQEQREPEAATGRYQQQLVETKEYMVAAAHPLATEAGNRILEQGGSAIDAAIATQLMLGLVEPQSSGIGGGAFILHWQAKQQKLSTFDGRETAPAAATPELFFEHGKVQDWRDAYVGGKSVGVPGVLKALAQAHEQYGKLPWSALFDYTIEVAEKGFPVSGRTAKQLELGWNRGLKTFEASKAYFYPQGKPLQKGDILKNPAYAALLKRIAKEGVSAFYQGENAQLLTQTVQQAPINAGKITAEDLAGYKAAERDPICLPYREYQVCGMAPPSSGGIAVLQIFGILQHFDLRQLAPDSVAALHLFSQASRLAFADRDRYVADPDFIDVPVAGLLDSTYLAGRAKLINLQQDRQFEAGQPEGAQPLADAEAIEFANTSHLSVVDKYGNAVSMTTSVENMFGSGLMVNGYILNNQLTDFSLSPRENGKWVANRVEANKRSRSSMAPMMVFDKDNNLKLVIGSPGGSRIINYVAQSIIAILDWKLDVQQSLNLPRVTHRNDYLALEADTELGKLQPQLQDMGYKVQLQDLNSGLHAIEIKNGVLQGAADPRREGIAAGK
ncbi:gamma-glutamyltransferase [Chromatiaceae bacterium AAb-1]|nr:gamma-glutamyltransferase [Chromatiaceae bacterium AAb-1]